MYPTSIVEGKRNASRREVYPLQKEFAEINHFLGKGVKVL
jgi:hypothetical protein